MYDLGCGTGKVVTQFAYESLCNSCNGIELGNNTTTIYITMLLLLLFIKYLGERRYKGSTIALAAMKANGDILSDKIGTCLYI